ncbi:GTP pyrophosphokinase [Fusobacterium sp. DD29]|uniref:RelA/SpoT family protein n=1 Tax=unclassified Fusobacterium TaxID=2648384 RepID=UPI001B8B2051|nr:MULTISPECIES: bifunctional (p)ppGpp synthetase/guanosine-3',5'-bis(diphosphate) 3'-pyrophosphohydrolase [unclassified Fusobacterium]MBR8701363.1 GTP pyrophosphokinase [Fusobacterium sp. DD45]MBR8711131.1 GTP pyrophosphokinase [Fusobacterium sp. DD28]MBR8749349.1 GTP pyrophosphokinase [Fusobacterium sp. DD29]MBR8751680.1 GTP pyrophosphokinase [Fusobacterium sp. DD26]MBR8761615.1 GTP pyrophosphokinase [Fusobacterium sp. DD25]
MNYWEEIVKEIEKNNLKVDMEKIKLAFYFAEECHEGQYRKSGEDYIMHPVEVVKILIDMKMDTDTIVAGILHDIVEDTLITLADIKYNFGETVATLVDGVTKLKTLPNGTKKQDENIRKMILAMAQNLRVIIIKLADRLHNMRTMKYMKPEKQISISQETLDIYAPLAHRLGIAKIKWELEDLALRYLKPKEYAYIKSLIDEKKDERREYIESFIKTIVALLHETGIKGNVKGRFKHFYSIYKKMYEKGKEFDDIYDLMGVRIIVDTEGECYNTLGVIHSHFRPVPGRFKDYIAVPKSNNYQSIHTTIVGPQGKFIEIQIRTEEMDKVAEEGVAAHWSYKENTKVTKSDQVYGWLRNILELQNEAETAQEFIDSVTKDIMNETVFVFSPKGDIKELPHGSTPLDFAFAIHTQIGCKCVGAKVNGKIVTLDYKLQNGDRVEIITSKNSKGPNKDWLDIVVTHGAKSKIKKLLKDQIKDEIIKLGRENLEKEVMKMGITLKEIEEDPIIKKHMEKNNIASLDDFYYHVGEKRSKIDVIIDKLRTKIENERANSNITLEDLMEKKKEQTKSSGKNDYGVIIDGVNNTLVRFARCCTPLPGDDIGGYVTKLTGIAIHRRDCKNFQNMVARDPSKEIAVCWDRNIAEKKENKYKFTFNVLVYDRPNLLIELLNMIANHKINLVTVNTNEINKDGKKLMNYQITIEIADKSEYKYLLNNMLKMKDVISVDRT